MLCNSCGCNLGNVASGYCLSCGGTERLVQQKRRYSSAANSFDWKTAAREESLGGSPAPYLNRLAAFILDYYLLCLIYAFCTFILLSLLGPKIFFDFAAWIGFTGMKVSGCGVLSGQLASMLLKVFLVGTSLSALYYTFFESSTLQATPGKYWFGLKTTDEFGERLDPLMALLRFFSRYFYIVPGLIGMSIIFLGPLAMLLFLSVPILALLDFVWVLLSSNRQSIHDRLSGTLVEEYYSVAPARLVLGYLVAYVPLLLYALFYLIRTT